MAAAEVRRWFSLALVAGSNSVDSDSVGSVRPRPGTGIPDWLLSVRPRLEADPPSWFTMFEPPERPRVRSAVLILFADGPHGPDVVLTERASSLRSHAAQVSFPGGKLDPTDAGPVEAAIREAEEEIGVDPQTVEVIDALPALYLYPSHNAVTPVLAWWRDPHPVGVVDSNEVAQVIRAGLADLVDPQNRFTAVARGFAAPGFLVHDLFIWGFTAVLLAHVLDLGGIALPWDESRVRQVPRYLLAAYGMEED